MTDEHTESRDFEAWATIYRGLQRDIAKSAWNAGWEASRTAVEARIASLTAELDELKARMPVGPYILPNGVVNANLMDDGTDQAPTLKLALELSRRLRADSLRIDLPIIDRDEARARVAWQPIETAPTDGTHVLLSCDEGDCCYTTQGWFSERHATWWMANEDYTDAHSSPIYPQFWQPLPEPAPLKPQED